MQPSLSYDAAVVGGGIAGLTAAAFLTQAGLRVLLLEKEPGTGGLVNSFDYKGFTFDGGIRGIENSGIVSPMLRQLGIQVDFVDNGVSVGLGSDVISVDSAASVEAYRGLLSKYFPGNERDIAAITGEIRKVMGYLDVLYGIDNPLFMDMTDLKYAATTLLPWSLRYLLNLPKINRLFLPVDEHLARFSTNQALLDVIAQHFFQKTPAYFALSYFSLYLDYRYPKGGTGSFPQALERFIIEHGGEIRTETRDHLRRPGAASPAAILPGTATPTASSSGRPIAKRSTG